MKKRSVREQDEMRKPGRLSPQTKRREGEDERRELEAGREIYETGLAGWTIAMGGG